MPIVNDILNSEVGLLLKELFIFSAGIGIIIVVIMYAIKHSIDNSLTSKEENRNFLLWWIKVIISVIIAGSAVFLFKYKTFISSDGSQNFSLLTLYYIIFYVLLTAIFSWAIATFFYENIVKGFLILGQGFVIFCKWVKEFADFKIVELDYKKANVDILISNKIINTELTKDLESKNAKPIKEV